MVQIVPPADWSPGDEEDLAAGSSAAAVGEETGSVQPASEPAAAAAPAKSTPPKPLPQQPASPKPVQPVGAPAEAAISAALSGSAIVKRQAAQAPGSQQKAAQPAPKQPAAVKSAAVQPPAAPVRSVAMSPFDPSEVTAPSSRWFWPTFSAATFLALVVAGFVIYLDRHNAVSADATSASAIAVPPANQTTPASQTSTSPIAPAAANPPPAKSAVPADAANPAPPAIVAPTAAPRAAASPAATPLPTVPPLAVSRVPTPKTDPAPPAAAPTIAAPSEHAAGPDAASDTAPPAVAAPAAPQPLARPSLQRIPPRNVDVEARLADRVAAIEFQQSPLWQFLGDLSQLSTVPISLDADALSEMNLSADVPVSVQLKNTTLAGILDEALAVHGLGWRVVGHQIEVGRMPAQELRRVRYSVADLAGDRPESRRQFAAMVHSLVEPNGWSEANGSATSEWSEGALMVTAGPSAHAQLLVLCEKLRNARGLPLRSRIDPVRFHLDSRTAHAKAALDTPITMNFARPEALEKILAYLRGTTRLNLLVDNVALAEDGMSAESEAVLTAQQQSFGPALTTLLEPMELTYRAIDDRTFEITTPKAAARHAEIEFYPAGDVLAAGSDGHELVARITRELNAAIPASPAASPPTLYFDTPSKYLIVRAPQSVQRRLESLLGSWRVAKQ
jgi:hypothetical protein